MAHAASAATAYTALDPMRLVLDTHVWLDLLIFRDPATAPLARSPRANGC